jgi:hypothetical protein
MGILHINVWDNMIALLMPTVEAAALVSRHNCLPAPAAAAYSSSLCFFLSL